MPLKILVHGTGAIGSIYVYLLLQAGCDVTAVCRSNLEAVKRSGFLIDSEVYGKNLRCRPKVVRTPQEAATSSSEPFDYILVCAKALPEAGTPSLIAPAVTKGKTTIVLIQNGIGIEDEYVAHFPDSPLLSCVVYLPTTQIKPGHVQMGFIEKLEVGTFPSSAYNSNSDIKSATDTLLSSLQSGGSNATLHPDVQEQRWKKLLLNAPWNPICALTLSRDVAFLGSSPAAESLIMEVMLEVTTICKALGYESITEDVARVQLDRARERKGGKGIEPSMLVDVLQGRRMEVEVILGRPVQIAKDLGIDVPRMETIYVLANALDAAVAKRRPGASLEGDM
nr:uncharacterized protein CFP56_54498 [Quercus suber]